MPVRTSVCGLLRNPKGRVFCELPKLHAGAHEGRGAKNQKYRWKHTCGGVRQIRIDDLSTESLPADELIAAIALSLEELAIAQSMVLIHGRERGYQENEPVFLWSRELMDAPSPFAKAGA